MRGYAWPTIVPAELAAKVGGADGLAATGAFAEVRALRAGGVWLRATDDFRDYDVAAATPAFHALAPILPPGLPRLPEPYPNWAPRVVVALDPAAV